MTVERGPIPGGSGEAQTQSALTNTAQNPYSGDRGNPMPEAPTVDNPTVQPLNQEIPQEEDGFEDPQENEVGVPVESIWDKARRIDRELKDFTPQVINMVRGEVEPFTEELKEDATPDQKQRYENRRRRHMEEQEAAQRKREEDLRLMGRSRLFHEENQDKDDYGRPIVQNARETLTKLNDAIQRQNTLKEFRAAVGNFGLKNHILKLQSAVNDKTVKLDENVRDNFNMVADDVLIDIQRLREGKVEEAEIGNLKERISRLITGKDKVGEEGKKIPNQVGLLDLVRSYEPKEREVIPRSLEDLAELIMESSEDKWKAGGDKALINKEGRVDEANFLAWIRDRIYFYHDFNPDSEIDLFQNISIPTMYRQISFMEMLSFSRYFNTRVEKFDGYQYKTDDNYDKLKYQLLYEVWLFQTSHNNDANFRLVSGNPEEVLKALQKMNYTNIFTKDSNRLLRVLKMSAAYGDKEREVNDILIGENGRQGSVGKAIRRALLAYYHLPEGVMETIKDDKVIGRIEGENMFEKVLRKGGEAGVDGFEEFYKSMAEQLLKEGFKVEMKDEMKKAKDDKKTLLEVLRDNPTHYEELMRSKFNIESADSRKLLGNDMKDYVDMLVKKVMGLSNGNAELNIFNDPKKNLTIDKMVRTAIQDAVGKKEGLDSEDAQYAGAWASTFVHWTGIAARGDTLAISHDKTGNWMNTKEYRLRQSRGRSDIGNKYNVFGIKRLMLNFWEGLKVKDEGVHGEGEAYSKSLLAFLQGGNGSDVNMNEIRNFEFEGYAQRQYTMDHVTNAAKVYEYLMSQYGSNFNKFLKRDAYGRVVFDPVEAGKILKGIWHDLRYTIDLNGFNLDEVVRGWWMEDGKLVFGNKTLRELMFDDEVNKMGMYKRKDLFPDKFKKDENGKIQKIDGEKEAEKRNMARNVFMYLVAKEVLSHREWGSGYERWELEELEPLYSWLGSWPNDLMEEELKDGTKTVHNKGSMWSYQEIEKVAKSGKGLPSAIFMERAGFQSAGAGFGGAMKGIEAYFKALFGLK